MRNNLFLIFWLFQKITLRQLIKNPVRPILTVITITFLVAVSLSILQSTKLAVNSFSEAVSIFGDTQHLTIRSFSGNINNSLIKEIAAKLPKDLRISPVLEKNIVLICNGEKLALKIYGIDLYLSKQGENKPSISKNIVERCGLTSTKPLTIQDNSKDSFYTFDNAFDVTISNTNVIIDDLSTVAKNFSITEESASSIVVLHDDLSEGIDAESVNKHLGELRNKVFIENNQERRDKTQLLLGAYTVNLRAMVFVTAFLVLLAVIYGSLLHLESVKNDIAILEMLGVQQSILIILSIIDGVFLSIVGSILGIAVTDLLSGKIIATLLNSMQNLYNLDLKISDYSASNFLNFLFFLTTILTASLGYLLPTLALVFNKKCPILYGKRSLELITGFLIILVSSSFVVTQSWGSLVASYLTLTLFLILAFLVNFQYSKKSIFYLINKIKPTNILFLLTKSQILKTTNYLSFSCSIICIGMSLMIAISVLTHSFRISIFNWSAQTFNADLYLKSFHIDSASAGLSKDLINTICTNQSVESCNRITFQTPKDTPYISNIEAKDLSISSAKNTIKIISGRFIENIDKEILLSESAAQKLKKSPDQLLNLYNRDFLIKGIFRDYSQDNGTVLIDMEIFSQITNINRIDALHIYFAKDAANKPELINLIQNLGKNNFSVLTNQELNKLIVNLFNDTFAIMETIQILIVGLCLFIFIIGILQQLNERKDHYKLLYQLGVNKLEMFYSLNLEGTLILAPTLFIGLFTGIIFSFFLVRIITPNSFGWNLDYIISFKIIIFPILLMLTANVLANSFAFLKVLRNKHLISLTKEVE